MSGGAPENRSDLFSSAALSFAIWARDPAAINGREPAANRLDSHLDEVQYGPYVADER
jgi:hypothetical protein